MVGKVIYRQGDVILEKVNGTRKDPYGIGPGRIRGPAIKVGDALEIVGETGHTHRLPSAVLEIPTITEMGTPLIVRLIETGDGGALMTHPEHPELFIPGGLYRVRQVREYTPEGPRFVDD